MLIFFEDFSVPYYLLKYLEKQGDLPTNALNELSRMRFVMNSNRGRNTQCVRFSIMDAVESLLNVA